ncbi:MAG: hypothetical protein NZ772_15120 [Cyanobacteria bacterium]|nr:hypothetical protein [Cyanobacteriota bacterium]MDW8202683.1 hypothetical protein [Cyanobacteriota bacterium SKYGB_h_bin112]
MNLTLSAFVTACLRENNHRMSKFDPRLLRPQLMPMVASWGLKGLALLARYHRRS